MMGYPLTCSTVSSFFAITGSIITMLTSVLPSQPHFEKAVFRARDYRLYGFTP